MLAFSNFIGKASSAYYGQQKEPFLAILPKDLLLKSLQHASKSFWKKIGTGRRRTWCTDDMSMVAKGKDEEEIYMQIKI